MADTLTSRHARHDRMLIAAAVDRDRGTRPPRVRALLSTCLECARLHADLLALAIVLPTASIPSRPRDFTLTAADAERLRPRGLRYWLGLIGTSRDTITRPLAIGFTTLGLAGLLVATVPGALPGVLPGSVVTEHGSGAGAPQREIQSAASPSVPVVVSLGSGDAAGATDAGVGSNDPRVPPAFVALSTFFVLTGGSLLVVRRARPRGHR